MKKQELISFLEEFAPKQYAEHWDNVGFLLGKKEEELSKVYICLDVQRRSVEEAIAHSCNFILSHHPFIFQGMKSVTGDNEQGRLLLTLAEHKISVFSMHTNFDSVKEGMGDLICSKLSWKKEGVLQEVSPSSEGVSQGIGFYTRVEKAFSCEELAAYVKEKAALPYIEYFDSGRPIQKIAVCPGSGKSFIRDVIAIGADAYITGDLGHHDAVDALGEGLSLLNAGHYGLERFFVPYMSEQIRRHFPKIDCVEEKEVFLGKIL